MRRLDLLLGAVESVATPGPRKRPNNGGRPMTAWVHFLWQHVLGALTTPGLRWARKGATTDER